MPTLLECPQLIDLLTQLGYPAEHQLIKSLRNKQSIDLNTTDGNGFTPLRIAIQKQDKNKDQDGELIKTLFSLQPHHEYLSDYDRAIINEVVGGKKDKFKKLKVPSHRELISVIQALYSIAPDITDRGICFGIAHMRRQAFFAGKTDVFSKRLKNIKYNVCPLIQKAMKEVKAEGINPTNQNLLFNKLREKLQNQFPYSTWYDLYAFLDGVILYFNSSKFPQLFDKKTPLTQLALPAEPLLRPTNVMGLPSQHVFSGYYTKSTLSTYFECLDNALKHFKGSVFFGISIGGHTFTLEYTKGKWIYTDANYLDKGEKEFTSHEMAQLLLKYYKSPLIFAAKPFIVPDSAESFNQCMDVLIKDPKWTDLHEQITKEQSTQKNSKGNTLLHIAAAQGDVATIKRFVAAGVPCNLQNRDGFTPFHSAVCNGHVDMVKELLNALGGNKEAINKPENDGFTPLHSAVCNGHVDMVKELLNALGGNKEAINKPDNDGFTPLHIAVSKGHVDIVKELLNILGRNKEAINKPTKRGGTPLFMAAIKGHVDIVKELLKVLKGDKEAINKITKGGFTPLHIAAYNGDVDIVKELLNALGRNKEAINELGKIGATPLFMAALEGHVDIVKELLNVLKGDKEAINKQGDGATPLFVASDEGHVDIVKELLSALEADKEAINTPRKDGATPLYIAAHNGFSLVVEELLKNGADVTKSTQISTSLMLEAAKKQNCEEKIHHLFTEKGIGDTLSGFTPLHAAVCFGHREVVELLVKNGALFETSTQGFSLYRLAGTMNRIDLLPLNLQQQYCQLKNTVNLIKPLLEDYKKARKKRFHLHLTDALAPKGKKAIKQFIEYLSDECHFLDSGVDGLIQAINQGVKQFPGVHFQSTLHRITLKLVDATPPDEDYSGEAKKILENQKHTLVITRLNKLYEQIEAMNQFAKNLTPIEEQTVSSLALQLKKDLDFFIYQHPQEQLHSSAWKQFQIKFEARLHSQDIIMSQQENWHSFALNLFLAVTTVGIALAIKAIYSQATTGQVTFFARETEKQKRRDELHQAMDEVKSSF